MPTKNRRVATYLPPELDDRLKAFIEERGLKGDSPALIAILSEYFEVSHQVDYQVDYSGFVTKEEFLDLVEKVAVLATAIENRDTPGSILGKLPEKLRKIESRIELLESATGDSEVHPGQMSLLTFSEGLVNSEPELSQVRSDLQNGSHSNLQPLSGYALARRIGRSRSTLSNNKDEWWNNAPEKFIEWIKQIDPDGIAWRYDPATKKYHPIISSS